MTQPPASRLPPLLSTAVFVLLAGLVALSIASERLLLPALIGGNMLLGALVLLERRRPWQVPVTPALLVLLLLLPVAWLVSPDRATSLPQIMRVLVGMLLFSGMLVWAHTRPRLLLLLGGAIGAWCALALLTIALVLARQGGEMFSLPLLRDTVNPNVLAGQLVLLFPLPLALLLVGGQTHPRWLLLPYAAATLLIGAAVILTGSRGAQLALVGGLLVALGGRIAPTLAGIGFVGALAVACTTPLLNNHPALLARLPLDLQERAEIWARGWWLLRDAPLTGIGMGTFQQAVTQLYPYWLISPARDVPHAHHLLLQIGVDLGIVGLLAWLTLLGSAAWAAWQLARTARQQHPAVAAIGSGLLAGMAALLLHGALDAVTWGIVRPAPLVWVVWGIALAAWQQRDALLSADRGRIGSAQVYDRAIGNKPELD